MSLPLEAITLDEKLAAVAGLPNENKSLLVLCLRL